MKKRLWISLLSIGLILVVVTAASIVVPVIDRMTTPPESVAIIGGADGPTAEYLTQRLLWELLQGRIWLILAGVVLVIAALILKKSQRH